MAQHSHLFSGILAGFLRDVVDRHDVAGAEYDFAVNCQLVCSHFVAEFSPISIAINLKLVPVLYYALTISNGTSRFYRNSLESNFCWFIPILSCDN